MNTILLILHFFGFGAGFAVSAGNNLVMMLVGKASPEEAAGLRRFPPMMTRLGDLGLALLWITGIILIWTKYGGLDGLAALPWSFWAKMVCVVLLTLLIGLIHATMAKMKRGDMAVAARMPFYGRSAALLLLLILVFAVMAFE